METNGIFKNLNVYNLELCKYLPCFCVHNTREISLGASLKSAE